LTPARYLNSLFTGKQTFQRGSFSVHLFFDLHTSEIETRKVPPGLDSFELCYLMLLLLGG